MTFEAIPPGGALSRRIAKLLRGWNVELLLDSIILAAREGRCNALIDTGALITGLTNQEAQWHLGSRMS